VYRLKYYTLFLSYFGWVDRETLREYNIVNNHEILLLSEPGWRDGGSHSERFRSSRNLAVGLVRYGLDGDEKETNFKILLK